MHDGWTYRKLKDAGWMSWNMSFCMPEAELQVRMAHERARRPHGLASTEYAHACILILRDLPGTRAARHHATGRQATRRAILPACCLWSQVCVNHSQAAHNRFAGHMYQRDPQAKWRLSGGRLLSIGGVASMRRIACTIVLVPVHQLHACRLSLIARPQPDPGGRKSP